LWIAMERVHGVTLTEWLKLHGPMPLGQFVPFFERIAAVVHTIHERGIVHRDLKPSNLMVIERAGELLPKLLDFGVAKLLDSASRPEEMLAIDYPSLLATEDSADNFVNAMRPPGKSTVSDDPAPPHPDDGRLTQNNHTVGSPPYIPPEQWSNAVTVGPASDLYALAVVAFEALTGRRPFQGETMADYAELHCHGKVPPLGGSFPPALDRMFQRALAKRPGDRWGSALELAAALRASSGIVTTRFDLPRLDQDVRDAWLAEAPQPLAESIAELDNARGAVVVVPRFRVVEATNVQTGMPVFVITDGTTRAECRTTEATDRVRAPYGFTAVQGRTRHRRAQHLGSPSRRRCSTSRRRCCPGYGHGTEGDHAEGPAQLTPHAITPSSCSAGERTK